MPLLPTVYTGLFIVLCLWYVKQIIPELKRVTCQWQCRVIGAINAPIRSVVDVHSAQLLQIAFLSLATVRASNYQSQQLLVISICIANNQKQCRAASVGLFTTPRAGRAYPTYEIDIATGYYRVECSLTGSIAQSGNLHRVSKKLCKLIFLSELCQISTDCENFWHKDSKENKLFCGVLIFHLT